MSSSQPRPDQTESVNPSGRGRNSQGRGGRGRGRGGRGNGQQSNSPKFQGQEPTLKECVFDYSEDPQSKRYLKNVEHLVGYIGSNFTSYNSEFQQSVEDLQLNEPEEVKPPKDSTDTIAMEEWKMKYKMRAEQEREYRTFRAAMFSLILGQCTQLMKDKLQAKPTYDDIKKKRDGIALLALIKQTTFTYDSGRIYPLVGRDKLKEEFYTMRRRNNQSIHSYYEVFRAKAQVLQELGVLLYDEDLLQKVATDNNRSGAPTKEDKEEAQQRCLAIRFIRTCGAREYESHLQNTYLDNQNYYPKTLADARAIIDNRMQYVIRQQQQNTQDSNATGVAYHTREQATPDDTSTLTGTTMTTTGQTQSQGQARSGTDTNGTVVQTNDKHANATSNHMSFSALQSSISPEWLLLDNQSTVDIIHNKNILENIHTASTPITISSHAGHRTLHQQALLPGYGLVWYDPQGPANILSLHNAQHRFRITYDSHNGNHFQLLDPATSRIKHKFVQSPEGLFYMNLSSLHGSFLTTVKENEAKYTEDEIRRAREVRVLQEKIGRPSTRDLIYILNHKLLPNVPYTSDDVRRAERIYGTDLGSLKGKTTRRRPPKVDTTETVPPPIQAKHKDVALAMDVMHINDVSFLVMTSRLFRFSTMDAIPNKDDETLIRSIKKTIAVFRRGGLRPRILMADGAFTSDEMEAGMSNLGLKLNTTARDEHVGDIERHIRTVKERVRSVYASLPFPTLPKVMLIELAKFATFWLNGLPNQNNQLSITQSPRELVTGETVDFNRHCRFEFGEYVQCHEQHSNNMDPRTIGAIALRPTGNRQGSYYFMSLETGRIITRNHATRLPMPTEVIQRVANLAASQQMQPGLAFGNRDNRILALDDDNPIYEDEGSVYQDNEDDDEALRYDDEYIDGELDSIHEDPNEGPLDEDFVEEPLENQGVDGDEAPENPGVGFGVMDMDDMDQDDGNEEEQGEILDEGNGHVDDLMQPDPMWPFEEEEPAQDGQELEQVTGTAVENNEEMEIVFEQQPTEQAAVSEVEESDSSTSSSSSESGYNLRPNRERSYAHRYGHTFAAVDTLPKGRYDGYLLKGVLYLIDAETNQATPQMSMRMGIKLFGDKGREAVKKEIRQLHERGVLRGVHKTDLSWEQIKKALNYLMFLKRKRCGKIKGRGCADGRKQRDYIEKEDAASPTVATEAVFITAVVDAVEKRHVVVADIPGAFMHSDMDPNVHMRIEGLMAELLLEVDPDMYTKFLVYENKKPVIYVEMLKALYGTLRAARLFWIKLSGVLKSWGYTINPYDACVANKIINGKQCTITWHIDDLKISHVDHKVVEAFVSDLQTEFGKLGDISVSRGSRHDYLGMFLDYSEEGILQVDMRPYIKTILAGVPPNMLGKAQTPAANHIYHINEDAEKLSEHEADRFHSITMQLAYLAHRGRPDIRTAVSFLATRVSTPDKDDYRKLARVIKYLQTTINLVLRLEGTNDWIVKWWVDASYAVHPNTKGHTGGCMTLGKGTVIGFSAKQKLVARSSTECELIGIHDVMPTLLWTRNFMEAQGLPIKDVILHQDNQSSILLAKNGRMSSSKRTKHIDVRYFFVTDRIKKKDLRVEFCPTEQMIADFFF